MNVVVLPTRSKRSAGRHPNAGTTGAKHHQGTAVASKHTKLSAVRILHLIHRFAIFLCAVGYVFQCFSSCYTAVGLLRGRDDPSFVSSIVKFGLISKLAGNQSMRESILIKNNVLGGRTDPLNGTLYLLPSNLSLTKCANLFGRQGDIYDNEFLRPMFASLVQDISYHIPELRESETELIAPVVDCTTTDTTGSDTTVGRFFFLTRNRKDPDSVELVVLSMSNQEYAVVDQIISGPVGVATVQRIRDMRERDLDTDFVLSPGYPYETPSFRVYDFLNVTDDNQWLLQSRPAHDDELSVTVKTANRDGFFVKAETEQSNINNAIWVIESQPYNAIATWKWVTKPVLHDSWAWVHGVQFFIGLGLLSNLVVLCLATYRNFRAGKWWIGDAFVSISTSQLVNGAAVLLSWFMNEYWVLHEFCFGVGFALSDVPPLKLYDPPIRVDLFTLYLSACGVIGLLCNERIDPLFATACFHIGFDLRLPILRMVPRIRERISEYSTYSYLRGVSLPPTGQELISPMELWTTHAIGKRNYAFVAQCLFPIFSTLVLIFVYVGIRKLYRRYHQRQARPHHSTSRKATAQLDAITFQKRVLTVFEVATGTGLENRFGLVSDYESCLFIKGMKFASADGIYSCGFLIANQKFLLQTSDYWSIVLMKIIRRRYRNVFVYDVNGSAVQQTARLVYPQTLSFDDLLHINISVLS